MNLLKIKIISAAPGYWYYNFIGKNFTIDMNTIKFDHIYDDYRCDVVPEDYDDFAKKFEIKNNMAVAILLKNTNYKALIRKEKLIKINEIQ